MNTPKIRFKGFEDAWEQRKLRENLSFLKDGTHGTHKDVEDGPLLLSAKNIKNGTVQWDESDRRISEDEFKSIHANFKLKEGDVLLTIVGSIGETAILNNSEGITFQRSVAFLRPASKIISEFLYSEIQGYKFQKELNERKSTSAQPGIYLSDLGEIPISYPINMDEQVAIGHYFTNIDHLITLHQRKCDETKQLKKFMLQKMFPKNGEKNPEIRFKGFTDDWEQRKLIDYLDVSNEKNKKGDYKKTDVLSVSGEVGIVNQIEFQGRSFAGVSVENYGIVNAGDIVYTKSPLKANPYGIIKTNKGKVGIVSTLYAVYKPKENIDSNFVQIYFELDSRMNSYMHPLVNKGAKNDMKVSDENALKGNVTFPKINEQKAISNFITELDHLITLHQRKCEKLKELKKFMLQNMFV